MRTPYTRSEITDIMSLVADRLQVRDRWEYERWHHRAAEKTRELRENIARRNMKLGRTWGRLKVTLEEVIEQKREVSA